MDAQTVRNIQIQLDSVGHELTRLQAIEGRITAKVEQLEQSQDPTPDRAAHLKALRWAIGRADFSD